jgi:cysteinyl-tRNA synthetase
VLQAHYRSTLDITEAALNAAEAGFKRLMEGVKSISTINTSADTNFNLSELLNACYEAMNDDFHAPKLVAQLFEIINHVHKIHRGDLTISSEDLGPKRSEPLDFGCSWFVRIVPTKHHLDRWIDGYDSSTKKIGERK